MEFAHKSDLELILDRSEHVTKKSDIVPVHSPFLWFRAHKKSAKLKLKPTKTDITVHTNGLASASQSDIKTSLQAAESVRYIVTN